MKSFLGKIDAASLLDETLTVRCFKGTYGVTMGEHVLVIPVNPFCYLANLNEDTLLRQRLAFLEKEKDNEINDNRS